VILDFLFKTTVERGASDLHIEAMEDRIVARIRLDGYLQQVGEIPNQIKEQLFSRLKIMANLNVAERRLPQDGRIKFRGHDQEVDMRINTMPTIHGESVACRVLRQQGIPAIEQLGMLPQQEQAFRKGIAAPNGIILVTGPSGSGKTTTLYAAVQQLNQGREKIATCEDPVEYRMDGINQIEIKKDIGFDFATALRGLLRQDPDILLIGEIRDDETAQIAIQAAVTGHLVLSTLHTNSALGVIERLANMKIERFMLASALNTIIAQRLIRRLCRQCKQPAALTQRDVEILKIPQEILAKATLFQPSGCEACFETGYRGQLAVHEVIDFNMDEFKSLVMQEDAAVRLRELMTLRRVACLREAAIFRALRGETSITEALSV